MLRFLLKLHMDVLPKGALKTSGQGQRPLTFRHGQRVGGVLGDPDQKVESSSQDAVQGSRGEGGSVKGLPHKMGHKGSAKMIQFITILCNE